MNINPQAVELNEKIEKCNPVLLRLLSRHGHMIFFPKEGILKQASEARGKRINATIGIALEEDSSPMCLESLTRQVTLEPKEFIPYAPAYGVMALREKWGQSIREKNPTLGQKPMTCPIIASGLTHALTITAFLFGDAGDKIILPDKFWGNYKVFFENNFDLLLSPFNTFQNGKFDLQSFEGKLKEDGIGKKIVLLNMPNNPTGYTVTEDEAVAILNILKQSAEAGNEIVVICDDAYFGLVYENGVYKESLFGSLADLHENILAVKIDGLTKEEYAWGLRIGFITLANKMLTPQAIEALEEKIAGAIRSSVSNCSHISQTLMLKTFQSPSYESEKEKHIETLHSRYEKLKSILETNKERYSEFFEPLPFNSGYFMCIKLKNLEAEPIRQKLLNEFDTGIVALGDLIRVAFSSCPTHQLEELFENIYSACKQSS